MNLTIQSVRSPRDFGTFLRFPWKIYAGDKFWVPPLVSARRERLDLDCNPFWRADERELWLASRGIESVLIYHLGQAILKYKFKEVDMSLTGDDNPKSTLFQDLLRNPDQSVQINPQAQTPIMA